jgi:allantoin racemase
MNLSKILFINPVGHTNFDAPIKEYIEKYKLETTDVEVKSLSRGPHHLDYHYYETLIGPDMLHMIKNYEEKAYDAAVIGCFYDPFLDEAREIVENMVITAPEESALSIASTLGKKFSIIVGRRKNIARMEENVIKYGYKDRLASFKCLGMGVLDFHQDEKETERRIMSNAISAIEEDGAEVIVLGCTIQFGFFQKLQEKLHVPVIDAVLASFKYAEFLVELKNKLNWLHSKIYAYEKPPVVESVEWQLEKQFKDSLFMN